MTACNEIFIIDSYFKNINNFAKFSEQEIFENFTVDSLLNDDCATLNLSKPTKLCITTDALIENKHFLPKHQPEQIAHKALHVNLSDIAANAGLPLGFSLAINLPNKYKTHDWLGRFSQGLKDTINKLNYPFALIGGDTCSSEELSIIITCYGYVPNLATKRDLSINNKADYDYFIAISHDKNKPLGCAKIAFEQDTPPSKSTESVACSNKNFDNNFSKYFLYPQARVEFSQIISKQFQQFQHNLGEIKLAAIDISDGLLLDLSRVLKNNFVSNTGSLNFSCKIKLEPTFLPVTPPMNKLMHEYLSFGEDYELLYLIALPRVKEAKASQLINKQKLDQLAQTINLTLANSSEKANANLTFEVIGSISLDNTDSEDTRTKTNTAIEGQSIIVQSADKKLDYQLNLSSSQALQNSKLGFQH